MKMTNNSSSTSTTATSEVATVKGPLSPTPQPLPLPRRPPPTMSSLPSSTTTTTASRSVAVVPPYRSASLPALPLRHDEQACEAYLDDRSVESDSEYDRIFENRIKFSSKFYGRENELERLHSVFSKIASPLLLVGDAGGGSGNGAITGTDHQQQQHHQHHHHNDTDYNYFKNSNNNNASGKGGAHTSKTSTPNPHDYNPHGHGHHMETSYYNEIVLLAGLSGTGKSALVSEFVRQLQTSNSPHLFLSGKYSELQSADPFSAIAEALSKVYTELQRKIVDPIEFQFIQESVKMSVGPEGKALTDMVPELDKLICSSDWLSPNHHNHHHHSRYQQYYSSGQLMMGSGGNINNKQNSVNRLKYVFQNFMRALCTQQRPVIMFLDDLQWADEDSLDLLSALLLDDSVSHFMFVGAFRSNEVDEDHRLFERLATIGKSKVIKRVDLCNLSRDKIGEFIADSLNLRVEQVASLTEVIYGKTLGNIFFTMQSLEELLRKNALYYDVISFTWAWNLSKVELETALSDDVVEALKSKIRNLNGTVQKALTIAAFTRSTFDVNTITALLHAEGFTFTTKEAMKILDKAVLEGLLLNCVGSDDFAFAHDRIQQAAHSFAAPGAERNGLRARIAGALVELASTENGEDWMLFVAADHFNSLPSNNNMDPLTIMKLNLDVGERSVAVSAIPAAARYLQKGLEACKKLPNPWKTNYDLSLRLYRTAADVELAIGNYEVGYALSKTVLECAVSLEDKLPTYLSFAVGLGRNERHRDAIALSQKALYQLDEFPQRYVHFQIMKDFRVVKKRVRKMTEISVAELPKMRDEKKLSAMELMFNLSIEAFLDGNFGLFVLSVLRRLRLTFEYGLCAASAQAFAQYGQLLCSVFGDQKKGSRMARLALQTIQCTGGKHVESMVIYIVNTFIEPWTAPISETLENLEVGYKSGMECGDLQSSMYNLSSASATHWAAGYDLSDCLKLYSALISLAEQRKDATNLAMARPLRMLIVQLLGYADAPPNWDELEAMADGASEDATAATMTQQYLHHLQLAYYFGKLELAYKISQILQSACKTDSSIFSISLRLFFSCLAASGLAEKTQDKRYLRQALKYTKELKQIMRKRGPTLWHKYLLMDACCKACRVKDSTKVKEAFDLAILSARDAGFNHDEALANELAGEYLIRNGRGLTARVYLTSSRDLYAQW